MYQNLNYFTTEKKRLAITIVHPREAAGRISASQFAVQTTWHDFWRTHILSYRHSVDKIIRLFDLFIRFVDLLLNFGCWQLKYVVEFWFWFWDAVVFSSAIWDFLCRDVGVHHRKMFLGASRFQMFSKFEKFNFTKWIF